MRTRAAKKSQPKNAPKQKRTRRTGADLLRDLEARRARTAQAMENRLKKFDNDIDRVRSRYRDNIEVTQLLQTRSATDLENELQEVRRKSQLIKKALKQKV